MPYLGLKDGEAIKPIEAHPDATVECPSCGRPMGVRSSHYKSGEFIPTHFFHHSNPDGCSGEAPAHYMMKSVSAEKLQEIFPTATVDLEVGVGDRIADVRAKFEEPVKPYGNGLIVEAQHKNEDKEIGRVAREYFDEDYSVYWAYLSDFENEDLEFDEDRLWTVWPQKLPDRSGLEGYHDCLHQLLSRNGNAEPVTPDVVIPTEYLQDMALTILSPTQVTAQGWTTHKRIWHQSEGQYLSWFNVLEAPNGRRYLETWRQDTSEDQHDHTVVPATPQGIQSLRQFRDDVATVDEGDAYSSGIWWEFATAELPGYEGSGKYRLSASPDGELILSAERLDRRSNRYGITIPWKDGDETVIEQILAVLNSLSW